ncbi:MAG: hypothetical protein KDD42_08070, partial [Bdellovibrionales bacterium]|nr:hypothetical protein [Bdellovibrionales bacterium]
QIRILPGVTANEDLFLLNGLITVEWSVREISLTDRYEVVLEALYKTNVPAPVLVFNPPVTTIPEMRKGETIYGEIRLTNFGLIRADGIVAALPSSDEFYKFEFLANFPPSLEARESFILPYRVTALQDTDPSYSQATSGGAGGCLGWPLCIEAFAICANDEEIGFGACTSFQEILSSEEVGSCSGSFGFGENLGKGVQSGNDGGTRGNSKVQLDLDLPCAPGFGCDGSSNSPGS